MKIQFSVNRLFLALGAVFLVLLIITGAIFSDIANFLSMEMGTIDFWDVHGVLFLIFITVFPRLTLLLSTVKTGGLLWFIGWLIAPRFLVAILATVAYWNTNKILVIISWLVALSGESAEKGTVYNKVYKKNVKLASKPDDIEAEYKVKE